MGVRGMGGIVMVVSEEGRLRCNRRCKRADIGVLAYL
jgi:hypothetical protein